MAKKLGRPHNFRALSKPKQVKKPDHRHYWPYIPVLLLVMGVFLVSFIRPTDRRGVLAYATNVSNNGLLSATNQRRTANGIEILTLNSQLNAAAQAKAQDMATRNYWSHNTPEGQEPWVFISNAGYSYLKAGENLAYGFGTSDETVTGWMNSATHKANMLDANFTEVGFGFANAENYNGSGPETVVVAMYGKPHVLAAANNNPAPTAKQPVTPSSPTAPTPQPQTTTTPTSATESTGIKPQPVTTDAPLVAEPVTHAVSRVQTLTNGQAPWIVFGVGIVTGLALMFLLAKHAAGLRHLIRDGEKFILHHPLLDTVLVGLVLVGTILNQTSGFIK